jgi:hypothetical protein
MRFLRAVILAIGVMGLMTACGGGSKKAADKPVPADTGDTGGTTDTAGDTGGDTGDTGGDTGDTGDTGADDPCGGAEDDPCGGM